MKISRIAISLFALLSLTACANKTYKTYRTESEFKQLAEKVKGKTPKEAAMVIGEPMSAFYYSRSPDPSSKNYFMLYPVSNQDVKMSDILLGGDDLNCMALIFNNMDNYKSIGQALPYKCKYIMSGEKLDMSLVQ